MTEGTLFPGYIKRDEEQRDIYEELDKVRQGRESRAVLLFGPGGVGKTRLVRQLADDGTDDHLTSWLRPVDIDDSEYWLLSNLEQLVADQLDPDNAYFGPFREYLTRLPNYVRPRIGHETVVSHLSRIKRVFVDCYRDFVESTGKTVVITLDTVEAVRGMYLLLTLTQWMKALPATLFILAGRPVSEGSVDPLINELEDPYQSIPVRVIPLGAFTEEAASQYIDSSGIRSGLQEEERDKIVRLTRGSPLWLAFTVAYLESAGMPAEAEQPLAVIERLVSYRGRLSQAGQSLLESFKRSLVSPYRDTDFWHESVKRLAVVRESVNQPIWQQLMDDLPEPDDTADGDAWAQLLRTPWIRTRANSHFVTLHDAVAEELARRIIPVHDANADWRRELWQHAARIYRELAAGREAEMAGLMTEMDQMLQLWDARPRSLPEHPPTAEEAELIAHGTLLDAQKRELCQFKAIWLYYELLINFAGGCQLFLELFERAKSQHDILFQDLLAFEMQRFLPVGLHVYDHDDAVGEVIDRFVEWLSSDDGRPVYLEIGLSMADYLIKDEQAPTALVLLTCCRPTVRSSSSATV